MRRTQAPAPTAAVDDIPMPELSPDDIARLAALPTDANGNVALGAAELAEIAAYEAEQEAGGAGTISAARRSTSEAVSARGQRYTVGDVLKRRDRPFHFGMLVERLLPPESAGGDGDIVAEALLEVRSARLDNLRMPNTDALECLTNLTHLYIENNEVTSLEGLSFMLGLTTLIAHHNRVEDLAPIADLPRLALLDVGYNNISALQADQHLPRTLRALVLRGNPVAPNYDDGEDGLDREYLAAFRTAILAQCCELRSLDGFEVEETKPMLQLAAEAAAVEAAVSSAEAEADVAAGLATNVRDEDFVHDDEREGPGGGGGGAEDGREYWRLDDPGDSDDDAIGGAASQRPRSSGSKSASTAASAGGASTGMSARRREVHLEVAPGEASRVGRITDGLIGRYERLLVDKDRVVASAIAEGPEACGEEALAAMDEQRELRRELRAAQAHHSHLAAAALEAQWTATTAEVEAERARLEQRRAEVSDRASRPSAAYLRALELLKKDAGVENLDKFRQKR